MDHKLESSAELLDTIKAMSGVFDVYQVTTFEGYRKRPDGTPKWVRIEVRDAGPDDTSRWSVVATDKDGREASGNSAPELGAALAMVHWSALDKDQQASS